MNLPLINTLRIPDHAEVAATNQKGQGNEEEEGKEEIKKAMDTVPNPPSFYYNDIDKWNAKFAKHIKERDYFKKQFQKTSELTCRTTNTNIKALEDGGKSSKSADPKDNKHSLFNQVLKRRKSR